MNYPPPPHAMPDPRHVPPPPAVPAPPGKHAARLRLAAILATIGAALGLFFAAFSTHDYALHLDRQLHGTHCSFVPGLLDAGDGANACTAAMYSPYSAILRRSYWGGIPISLFGMGAFGFFLVLGIGLWIGHRKTSTRLWQAFGVTALTPALASLVMFLISLLKVHAFCKLCMGMYVGSALLAAGGVLALLHAGKEALATTQPMPAAWRPPGVPGQAPWPATPPPPAQPGSRHGSPLAFVAVLVGLGLFALLPSLVYAGSMPDYRGKLGSCGTLAQTSEKHGALVKLPTKNPKKPALLFVDPLCPTCKAFHERLASEGAMEQLDLSVAIFPLDSECNWMLDRSLHPGACELAKAFLCGEGQARAVLEWSYDNQESLLEAGKQGKEALRARIRQQFNGLDACMDSKATKQRLDRVLQFAVANKVPVSTPQMILGNQRICDEDTDLGLAYTLTQLAPEVFQP